MFGREYRFQYTEKFSGFREKKIDHCCTINQKKPRKWEIFYGLTTQHWLSKTLRKQNYINAFHPISSQHRSIFYLTEWKKSGEYLVKQTREIQLKWTRWSGIQYFMLRFTPFSLPHMGITQTNTCTNALNILHRIITMNDNHEMCSECN